MKYIPFIILIVAIILTIANIVMLNITINSYRHVDREQRVVE